MRKYYIKIENLCMTTMRAMTKCIDLLSQTKDKLLEEKDFLLGEKDDQLNRLHNIQKELLTYKKRIAKGEIVYIVSSENYARQGIYKIGRTKKI